MDDLEAIDDDDPAKKLLNNSIQQIKEEIHNVEDSAGDIVTYFQLRQST